MVATVANDGRAYRPRLVRGYLDRSSGHFKDIEVGLPTQVPLKPDTFALIKDALQGVVTRGTATRAKSPLVSIAGKTGTAQTAALRTGPESEIPKKFRDHAWFVSYAPAEAPKIAVAVLVEHMGHGGSAAAPLAKQVIESFVQLRPHEPMIAQAPPPPKDAL
jgi:penicillin-binding protein 2